MPNIALKDLLELSDSGVWGEEDTERGISVLRSTNFRADGYLSFDNLALRSVDAVKRDQKRLAIGDILLEKSGGGPKQPVGRVCLFRGDDRPHVFGNFLARLRPKREVVEPQYLYHRLWYFHAVGLTTSYQKQTSGIRNLELKRYLEIPIAVPTLAEQRRVVEWLSRAENIVRMRRDAEQKAREVIPALFLDMFGDPSTNPKGWERKVLGDLVTSIDSGKSPQCVDRRRMAGEWGVLKLGSVTWGVYDETEHKTLPPDMPPFYHAEVHAGDVLLSRKNTYELVGAPAYVWDTGGRVLLPDLIFRLNIARAANVDGVYLWALLSTVSKRAQLRLLASGAAASMPNISKGRLAELSVEIPPTELQSRFRTLAENARTLQLEQARASARASDAFQSLLAGVFGKET